MNLLGKSGLDHAHRIGIGGRAWKYKGQTILTQEKQGLCTSGWVPTISRFPFGQYWAGFGNLEVSLCCSQIQTRKYQYIGDGLFRSNKLIYTFVFTQIPIHNSSSACLLGSTPTLSPTLNLFSACKI